MREVPLRQRRAFSRTLADFAENHSCRDAAIVAAYASGVFSMREIGDYFGLHYSHVSRIISRSREQETIAGSA